MAAAIWHFLNGNPKVPSLASAGPIQVNTGTSEFLAAGALDFSTTQAATIANTSETVLYTFTIPANTLKVNGSAIRIRAFGSNAANANTKTMRIRFGGIGGTIVATHSGGFNNTGWVLYADIYRTGAATQLSWGAAEVATSGTIQTIATPAQDTTGTIAIVVTGENGSSSANDIVFRGALVELLGNA